MDVAPSVETPPPAPVVPDHDAVRVAQRRATILPAAFMVVLALVGAGQVWRQIVALQRVDEAAHALAQANLVYRLALDLETGLRGYLLTGDPRYLEPYERAGQRIDPECEALARLVSDDPPQLGRVVDVRREVAAWRGQVARPVLEEHDRGGDALGLLREKVEAGRVARSVRPPLDAFLEQEDRICDEWSAAARGAGHATLWGIGTLLVVGAVGLGVVSRRTVAALSRSYEGVQRVIEATSEERARLASALAAERNLLDAVIRQLPVGVMVVDASGKVVLANANVSRILREERPLHEQDAAPLARRGAIHADGRPYAPADDPIVRAITTREAVSQDVLYRHRDGGTSTLVVHAAPVTDDRGTLVAGALTFDDVTERRTTEEAIRASEQHLRDVLDALTAFVAVLTPDGKLVFANRAARESIGIGTGALGLPFEEAPCWSFSDESRARVRAAIERAARGEPSRYDVPVQGPDRLITIDFMLAPLRDGAGRIAHLIPSGIDVSARLRAEAERQDALDEEKAARRAAEELSERLSAVQAVTDAAIGRLGLDDLARESVVRLRAVLHADLAAIYLRTEDGLALTPRAVDGFDELVPGSDRVPLDSGFVGEISRARGPVVATDASRTQFANPRIPDAFRSLIGVPLVSGGRMTGVVMIGSRGQRTFTAQEARVLELVAERVASAVERGLLFESELRRRKLEDSNRELQEFATIASHDLQEPLRKIRAFGDCLRESAGARLDDEGRGYLERMQGAAARMQVLINDLLQFSRVTTKAQPFAPVDLAEVARAVVNDLEGRVVETKGRVELGPLPRIEADALQMRQLLQNLIGNALKFHKRDVPPVVHVRAEVLDEATDEARCRLSVQDNGIGFDEKYLPKLFQVFQCLHARNEYEGTGVGLAICRKIVERHHGTIEARSVPGQGSTFAATLPLRQREAKKEKVA